MKDAVKQGIESLELAIDKGNNQANTLFALGNLNYKIGKKQIASNYYKEIIKRSPKNSNKWKQAKSNLLKIEKEKKSK